VLGTGQAIEEKPQLVSPYLDNGAGKSNRGQWPQTGTVVGLIRFVREHPARIAGAGIVELVTTHLDKVHPLYTMVPYHTDATIASAVVTAASMYFAYRQSAGDKKPSLQTGLEAVAAGTHDCADGLQALFGTEQPPK
jgi:hypothetical protein